MATKFNLNEQLKLTLVISWQEASPRTLVELAALAFAGGTTAIQLREKKESGLKFYQEAQKLRNYCREHQRLFIVNDRLDIAMATEADGVHLGQNDLPVEVATHLWPGHIVGVSVSTIPEAQAALAGGASYLGLGAMFPTGSKGDVNLLNRRQAQDIINLGLPTVAIGGITPANAPEAWELGFTGLAVISALASAPDPTETARNLLARASASKG